VPAFWVANSALAVDHAAAGSFETAMQLLHRQIGVVNFAPLKPAFARVFRAARVSLPTLPAAPPLGLFLQRGDLDAPPPREASLPAITLALPALQDKLRQLYKAFTVRRRGEMGRGGRAPSVSHPRARAPRRRALCSFSAPPRRRATSRACRPFATRCLC
jgi:hypothetical protein